MWIWTNRQSLLLFLSYYNSGVVCGVWEHFETPAQLFQLTGFKSADISPNQYFKYLPDISPPPPHATDM